jgi:hypothetical protein
MPTILSSKHSLAFSNTGKSGILDAAVSEWNRVGQMIIDQIWSDGYLWIDKEGKIQEFNVAKNLLQAPMFIDYNRFEIETTLTGRAMSSLVTQICGCLGAACEKQRKRLYILEKGKGTTLRKQRKTLVSKIKTNIPQKPTFSKAKMEISSKCAEWLDDENGKFDGWIKVKSLIKDQSPIKVPIKFTKHSKKLQSRGGKMLASFLVSKDFADIRWELPVVPLKESGVVAGADQGMKDVLTISDGQTTPKTDIHGHSLESILTKMVRKRKGSRAMRRTQAHRRNFINWSINQVDFGNIRQLNLEQIWNIGFKNPRSRKMSHWTNTDIRDKVGSKAQELGVQVIEQSSVYRSQRCSGCGLVRKANRKGKAYKCEGCGIEIDSDFNAALNHEVELPEIPWTLRKLGLNRGKGFFWKPNGLFDHAGGSLESPLPQINDKALS